MEPPAPKSKQRTPPTQREKTIRDLVRGVLAYVEPKSHDRPDLEETPRRVQEWWRDFIKEDATINFTTFADPTADQVVAQTDIRFYSLCEHHMLPFFGHATVAYLPDGDLVGLSKLSRLVRFYARRLQTQERMTRQISDFLEEELAPRGTAVVTTARHLCMEMRGVEQPDAETTTSCVTGIFKEDSKARSEFLRLRNRT
jgi:GTP cyclohydrolase I